MRQPALNIAVKAARSAARVLIRMLNKGDQLSAVEKQKNDFVTEADHAAESAIIAEIQKAYPDHAILAEESGRIGSGQSEWIIDPLDGTRNYMHGLPHFCISIALAHQGVVEHGLVYNPLSEEMFTASRGGGAFLNNTRLRVSNRPNLDGALVATGFPFRERQSSAAYLAALGDVFSRTGDLRRGGSAALDLAFVAAGRLDGYWELGLQPWDLAAGALLVREAGGLCCDFSGTDGFMSNGQIIAGNLKLAGQLKKLVHPHLSPLTGD